MMKVDVIAARELNRSCFDRWSAIQAANPALSSPYFCPHFTRAVGEVRRDAFVGIICENEPPIGFFPFQRSGRSRAGSGRPIGGLLSDYQGVVCERGFRFDAREVVRRCGLRFYDFDSMLASQEPFATFHSQRDCSWIIDVSDGYEAYVQRQRAAHLKRVRDNDRLRRKVERDIGPLRFEMYRAADLTDRSRRSRDDVFRRTLEWKSAQYRRTRVVDVFAYRWTVELLDRIRSIDTPEFSGTVGGLFAGDRLLATHIGMRSKTIWHHWFSAYDMDLRSYGPGILLVMEMARLAPSMGARTIDLSRGREEYKMNLVTGSVPVARGWVEARSTLNVMNAIGRWKRELEMLVRNSPLMPIAAYPGKFVRMQRFK